MKSIAHWGLFINRQILRMLFPLALTWASFMPLIPVYDGILSLNPYPEGERLHHFFEQVATWLPILLPSTIALWILYCKRAFLRLAPAALVAKVMLRLLIHGLAWYVLITAVLMASMFMDYDPMQDQQGQYWPWAVATALLYAAVPSPLAAVFSSWWSLQRKSSD